MDACDWGTSTGKRLLEFLAAPPTPAPLALILTPVRIPICLWYCGDQPCRHLEHFSDDGNHGFRSWFVCRVVSSGYIDFYPPGSPVLPPSTASTPALRSSWTSRKKLPLVGKRTVSPLSLSNPTLTLATSMGYRGNSTSDMCKCTLPSFFLSLLAHPDIRKGLP